MSSVPTNPFGSSPGSSINTSEFQGIQRRRLKRLDHLSVAKLLGVLYGFLGLLFGVFFFILAVVGVTVGNGDAAGITGGIFVAVLFPVANAIAGFIGGLILAVLYNLAASLAGGIEFDLE